MWPKRILWFLLWNGDARASPRPAAGVHRGHVRLGADRRCAYLDYLYESKDFAHIRAVLPMPPSEYWKRQCHVGASSVSRAETDMRYDIGVDSMMFGSDYPHVEGHVAADATTGSARRSAASPSTSSAASSARTRRALYGFDLDVLDADRRSGSGIPVRRPRRARRQPGARAHAGRPPGRDGRPRVAVARQRRRARAGRGVAAGNCSGRVPLDTRSPRSMPRRRPRRTPRRTTVRAADRRRRRSRRRSAGCRGPGSPRTSGS